MKRTATILALVALALAAKSGSALCADKNKPDFSEPPKTITTTDGREMSFVWSDEFNGEGAPDPKSWSYEVGYLRNNEAQYYTKDRLENVFQKDGVLTIKTLKERYDIKNRPGNKGREFAEYTSGAIESLGKVEWLYGRVDVRAKLPKGKGIWPAIWMMGRNINEVGWPRCGEIDIMEYVGHTPRTSHATIHMQKKDGERWQVVSKGRNKRFDAPGEAPEERFYVYSLEWTKDKLLLLIDNEVVLEFNRSDEESKTPVWPFDKPCYIILNTAIGGAWGGEIADDTCPTEFLIDYVRLYQEKE